MQITNRITHQSLAKLLEMILKLITFPYTHKEWLEKAIFKKAIFILTSSHT